MQNISSNLTIFLKLFIPIIWIAFFGMFTLAVFFANIDVGVFGVSTFRLGLLAFFLIGCTILYFTLIQLKRVDMDQDFMYVSNYLKTYRYTYDSIDKITERDFLIFYTIHVKLKEAGAFGKKIVFLSRSNKLDRYLQSHPDVARQLLGAMSNGN